MLAQHTEYRKELTDLRNRKALSNCSRKLHPFLDEYGFIYLRGKVKNLVISYDRKYPALLATDP